jgi:hypothetical protein
MACRERSVSIMRLKAGTSRCARATQKPPTSSRMQSTVVGDKAGSWETWYRTAVPLADERFTEHLLELEALEVEKK